ETSQPEYFLVTCLNTLLSCQQGWREYENKCYFFSTDTKSWLDANAFCLEQSANLMSILDIHERVSLNDHGSEGVWEWSDGSPFIPYIEYDCGQVTGSSFGQWNDENCAVQRKYICKILCGPSGS
uniref:C-type lectin domain-containing protein n=1 Tax=Cyclopterus lumpus TaxID=8103 RepID=A0A8C2WJI4_CYCLU